MSVYFGDNLNIHVEITRVYIHVHNGNQSPSGLGHCKIIYGEYPCKKI